MSLGRLFRLFDYFYKKPRKKGILCYRSGMGATIRLNGHLTKIKYCRVIGNKDTKRKEMSKTFVAIGMITFLAGIGVTLKIKNKRRTTK